MESPKLKVESFYKDLKERLVEGNDVVEFCRARMPAIGIENEVKAIVDTALRERLQAIIIESGPSLVQRCGWLLGLSFDMAGADVCTRSLPVMLLTDMFELSTLATCEKLFTLVEDRVDTWKDEQFFRHVKNQLLRTCNDLLRRLSRSQNTVFCGRILVFLARFFPLFERSGLNLISEFNADHVTSTSKSQQDSEPEVAAELEEGEMPDGDQAPSARAGTIQMDQQLYQNFWRLQDVFRAPNSCYQRRTWTQFQNCATEVLALFRQHRLDQAAAKPTADSVFFSQYLTNPRLLELQLNDANFRRYILLQFLITLQYLAATVRFKTDAQTLTDEQKAWVKESVASIYILLEETPPDGPAFRKSVENLLCREEAWNGWKNDGCAELKPSERVQPPPPTKRRRTENASTEMRKLWQQGADNFDACRSPRRMFTPSVEQFFSQVLHATETERSQQFRRPEFCWRALRLLSQKSAYFFLPSNQMVKPLPEYLASALDRLSKDMPREDQNSLSDGAEDISDDELLRQADSDEQQTSSDQPQANGQPAGVTPELIEAVAEQASGCWKELALHLFKFGTDELEYFESTNTNPVEQAKFMLQIWSEQDEPDRVTAERIVAGLDKCGVTFKNAE